MFLESVEINSREGHGYVLAFSDLDLAILPESISKRVVEVVIATHDAKGINNAKTLFTFSKHIRSYLKQNDVILYSYCDSKDVRRSIARQHLEPQ